MEPKRGSKHGQESPEVQVTGSLNRAVLGDGKGLSGIGHGDGNHYTDILMPREPASGTPSEGAGKHTHSVDNTTGIHDEGVPMGKKGKKR